MSSTQEQSSNKPSNDEPPKSSGDLLSLSEVLQSINNDSCNECVPIDGRDHYGCSCRSTEGDKLTPLKDSVDASKLAQPSMETENSKVRGMDCPRALNSPTVDGNFLRGLEDYPTDFYSFTDYSDVATLASSGWNCKCSPPDNFSIPTNGPAGYDYNDNDGTSLGYDYGMFYDIQPISQGYQSYQPYDYRYAEATGGFTPTVQPHIAHCYCGDPINCYFRQGFNSFEATNIPQTNQHRQLYPDGFLSIPANDYWNYNYDYDLMKAQTMFDVKLEDAGQTLKWSGPNNEPLIMNPYNNFGNSLNQSVEGIETHGPTNHVKKEKRSPEVNRDIPTGCDDNGAMTSHVFLERLDYQRVRRTVAIYPCV